MNAPRRENDPEFKLWIEKAKAGSMEIAIGLSGFRPNKGCERANERTGPCPVCGGRDRFGVNMLRRKFNCRSSRGCKVKGNNALALALAGGRVGFLEACEKLALEPPPRPMRGETEKQKAEREARIQELQRKAAADEEKRRNAEAEAERYRLRAAREVWDKASNCDLAPVFQYLEGKRGIDTAGLNWSVIRLAHLPLLNEHKQVLHEGPVMLCAMVDAEGRLVGVHRTWIGPAKDGLMSKGRPMVIDPATGERVKTKKGLGLKKGAVIRLSRDQLVPSHRLFMGEGIETTLSVYTALRKVGSPLLSGSAFLCGIDLGNIAYSVPVPDWCRELVLLGDGDSDPHDTREALEECARRFRAAGAAVRIVMAPEGQDFNDMLAAA
ncbi:MAG: toprim domain-containing protein [Methylobacterium sp.]|nr:toprim domain-containing protein [Methylobacterium sp.]MCA4923988.1 toprim domain-containing protein [Methylobacterium sp.]